jgi:putative ABC transport system permease protein
MQLSARDEMELIGMTTAVHLALKEIWRNRARFLLFSLVVALITMLVLFIAALGTGLLGGLREYLEGLNADLIVYQDISRLSIASSRVDCSTRGAIRSIEGVRDVGPIGFSSVSVLRGEGAEPLDISLIGVGPGKPGEPPVVTGQGLRRKSGNEAIIDRTVARVTNLGVGDSITIRSVLGNEDEFYDLRVVGVSNSRKYGLQPSVFVPIVTWDTIRPKAVATAAQEDPACSVVAVQLEDQAQLDAMRRSLQARVDGIEAVDRKTAYENTPGYASIQTSLTTQNVFVLLIGMLVIGGFFQIQVLQKVPQIGMLKAIGTSNSVVALAAMIQVLITILSGVAIGSLVIFGVALVFPPNIPIVFELRSGATAVASLLLMGSFGGLVSIRYALRVEPLIALGLDS